MFEYMLATDQRNQSKWTVLVSLSGQCLAFGLALLIPLIYTQGLPPVQWARISLPSASAPPAPERPIQRQVARTNQTTQKVFTAPPSIPRQIAIVVDQPAIPMPFNGGEAGVAGSIGSEAGPAKIPIDLLTGPVAPPPAPSDKPKPVERAPEPMHVSGGVQAARILRRVVPIYPELARRARISGAVHLIGVIGKDGTIQNLRVVSGHPLLVSAAIEAVRQWLYKPTLLSGEPVEVIAPIEVNFNLN
jgi:protein TonB